MNEAFCSCFNVYLISLSASFAIKIKSLEILEMNKEDRDGSSKWYRVTQPVVCMDVL